MNQVGVPAGVTHKKNNVKFKRKPGVPAGARPAKLQFVCFEKGSAICVLSDEGFDDGRYLLLLAARQLRGGLK